VGKHGNSEGSITRRKNSGWVAQYTVYTSNGRKHKTLYGKTRQEVAAKLAKALSDHEGGLVLDAGSLTVGDWMDHWLNECLETLVDASKMAHSTFVRYAGIVRNHLEATLRHRTLKDLTRAEVRSLYNATGKELAPRAVHYVHVTLQ
jgi:integrase